MTYTFKTLPLDHQRDIWDRTKDRPAYGLLWEQGCGKTKPAIDTAAYLYEKGEVNTLLVVAPNGVDRNWITDEIPAHLPDHIRKRSCCLFYETGKAGGVNFQNRLRDATDWGGFTVLTMSYDAFSTQRGKEFAGQFMRKRKCFFVADESQAIKNPETIRTKLMLAASAFAPYRRILSGTPLAQGPFDAWSQVRFLDGDYWKRKGLKTWSTFKAHFAEFEDKPFGPGGRNIKVLKSYRNLDQLEAWLPEISHRLTKADALDLPEKIYQKRYVDLTGEQWKVYKDLKRDLMVVLDQGEIIEAPLAITWMLRAQQIACGYVTDIEGNVVSITGSNPRLEALQEIVEGTDKPGIIWARFTKDIDLIMEMLRRIGKKPVRYDGQVSDDQRALNKKRFQDGDADWFVGNQAAGATGLTLTQAKMVVYYSNSFRLVDRLQSEDRAHRIGQKDPVLYIDIVAPETIDERIVRALRDKQEIASRVLGDELKEWI